jgi:RNA polymerase sigma-70 factor (ECF subfamily)
MATNVCLNKIRADKLRNGPEFDVIAEIIEDSTSAEGTEKIETSILLDCIFSERDTKDRQIAILHYVDGYTLEETSKKMKMSVSGIRKRLEKLKEYATAKVS